MLSSRPKPTPDSPAKPETALTADRTTRDAATPGAGTDLSGAVVGVVGAGTMGAGIAQVAASAGHRVVLFDADAERVPAALAGIAAALERLVDKGRLNAAAAGATRARIRPATTLADLAGAGLVVEAIVEALPVKRALFRDLEARVAPDAVLATNTSSLSITDIADGLTHPERVVGMHFFNPAPVLPLVEVVSGAATAPAVADAVHQLATAWGKTPVRATSTPGFIVNRVARPYYLEPFATYEAGLADAPAIDAALRGAGFRMGPFELTDLIGHDVNTAVSRSVYEALGSDPRFTPSTAQEALVRDGRLGRKAAAGWYDYPPGPQPPAEKLPAPGDVDDRLARLCRPAGIDLDGGRLLVTDGRTAAQRAAELEQHVVVADLPAGAFTDIGAPTLLLLSAPDGQDPAVLERARLWLGAAGIRTQPVPDLPGLVVARTLAMLVNLAADAVAVGVATPDDVDLAMVKGVNYPYGPLSWGAAIGFARVVTILDNLAASNLPHASERFRVTGRLREWADCRVTGAENS